MLTRTETVRALLRTFNEAREAGQSREGIHGTGESTPRLSRMWHDGSYAKLELSLLRMRGTERTLYWHISERYLRSTERTTNVRVRLPRAHGRSERILVRRVVRSYSAAYQAHDDASQRYYRDLGVSWLVDDLDAHGVTPFLPKELLEVVAA